MAKINSNLKGISSPLMFLAKWLVWIVLGLISYAYIIKPFFSKLFSKVDGTEISTNIEDNRIGDKEDLSDDVIKSVVDTIAKKIIGPNLYIYPEIINQLAKFSPKDLGKAVGYWNLKYKAESKGNSLYYAIKGEWNSSIYYKPALNWLKENNLFH